MACVSACHTLELTRQEGAVLNTFCRFLCEEAEVGYVLEGVKPMCILGIDDDVEMHFNKPIHKASVVLSLGVELWNKKIKERLDKERFFLKTFQKQDSQNDTRYLLVINRDLFLKVVQENLVLFRYVLGPAVTPESLLHEIMQEEADFSRILAGHNNVLVGILLGYGTENAILISRLEYLDGLIYSGEVFPYKSHHLSLEQDFSDAFFLAQKKRVWGHQKASPSFSFSSLEEESIHLKKIASFPCDQLLQGNPRFVFGIRNDMSFSDLEKKMVLAKTRIQKKIRKKGFLKKFLSEFCSCKLVIRSEETVSFYDASRLHSLCARALIQSLHKKGYDLEAVGAICAGFSGLVTPKEERERFIAWPDYLANTLEAIHNFEKAQKFFYELKQQNNLVELVPDLLYAKIIQSGSDQKNNKSRYVQMDYQVFDPEGERIGRQEGEWIDLSQAIVGLVRGIEGMGVGEIRQLFIHPVLAYGQRTLCAKNSYLLAHITLRGCSGKWTNRDIVPQHVPPILQPEWLETMKKRYLLALQTLGRDLASSYQRISSMDIEKMKVEMDLMKNQQDAAPLSGEEKQYLREVFMDFYHTTL